MTKRPLVLAAVILAMFMGAIEATIVSTAMPAIVADLGGFSLYSWVFSAYLLMNAATVLIYGKLADIFGRKPIMVIGVSIFSIGSLLCGLAGSMEQLIVYRFIQGVGASAVMPVATTIVGDIYTKEERAKVSGTSNDSNPALRGRGRANRRGLKPQERKAKQVFTHPQWVADVGWCLSGIHSRRR